MRLYRDRQRSLDQLQRHLEVWAGELTAWEVLRRHPIGQWSVAAPDAADRPIRPGDAWDNRFGIHRFRTTALVDPATAAGEIELCLDFGGEALVRLSRADGSEITSLGSNPRHPRFAPVPGEPFHIEAEVAARSLFGIPHRNPAFARAELFAFYPEVRALRRRVEIARDTILTVHDEELARALYEVVELALSGLRLPTATGEVGPRLAGQNWAMDIWERSFEPTDTPAPIGEAGLVSVRTAITQLDGALAELRAAYPKMGKVLATGHAHIDYAWLWPQPETVRKIIRTFSSVNALMAAHPDFTFLQSSSLFYRHIEEENPALLEAVRGWVAEGRWEPIGGMLIECDTNMPSAEAFLRQFLFGQRDFERYFGAISRTAWLPDTFGFTGAMPQIMRHAGIEALVTIKVSWNETNKLPENLFRWRGNDGSEVMTHTFDAYDADGYNMWMTPGALAEVWGKHKGKDLTDTVIATYGWGDGGGGPDPDQIETMALINLMPAIPTVSHGNIQAHLDRIATDLADAALPTWSGEMYLEYHRATLTTQGRTKQLNRRAEFGLVAAEAMSVIAALEGADSALPDLADDWVLMLRNQFHDILPGSSIREVYEQTEPELRGIVDRSEAIARAKLGALATARRGKGRLKGVAVANLSGSAKTSWQIVSGEPLPASLAPQAIAGGYAVASNRPLAPLSVGFVAEAALGQATASAAGLENDLVRVRLDAHGRVISLFDKRCGRELVDGAANRLMVYRNDLPRNFDAWDIEPGFALGGEELLALDSLAVTASGSHLAEITLVRTLGSSRIEQRIRLWANSPRLEFVTSIDWHDRRTYLRAEFPVTVLAGEAQFDQAIGTTTRATHDNTTWQQAQFESCGHRFASLSETDWGAALLSSDKYGFSAKGNVLTLSLIRGPMYPDMLADEGHHEFTYALLPHDGRHWSEAVQAEADLVSDPLRVLNAEADEAYDIRPVGWHGQQMRFHALKPSEDGTNYVLRLSEAAGRRGQFGTIVPTDRKPVVVDGLEREVPDTDIDQLRPYQLISLKF